MDSHKEPEVVDLGEIRWWAIDWQTRFFPDQNFVTITPLALDREEGENSEPYQLEQLALTLTSLKLLQKDVDEAIRRLERTAPGSTTPS
jgi:hypothetical protein